MILRFITYVTRVATNISGNIWMFDGAYWYWFKFYNIEDKEFFSQAIMSSNHGNEYSNLSCQIPDIWYDEYDMETFTQSPASNLLD